MTKSTKIIAALGVAAGLGIAALPMGGVFATDLLPNFENAKTTTDVEVQLTVAEAIAIASSATECKAGLNGESSSNFTVKSYGWCTHELAGMTNNENGFKITVKTKENGKNYLAREGVSTETDADKIEATAEAVFSGDDQSGRNWAKAGWNIENTSGVGYIALSDSEQEYMNTKGQGLSGQAGLKAQQVVKYNISTREDQNKGDYKVGLTYTITANGASL